MRFFNKILGIPETSEIVTDIDEDDTNEPAIIANLELVLQSDGTMRVAAAWKEHSPAMAKLYGQFLFHVMSGGVKDNVMQQLILYADYNVVQLDFVKQIMESFDTISSEINEEPIVSPSQALKFANMGKEE